jgi:GcrA cell cycle regulator
MTNSRSTTVWSEDKINILTDLTHKGLSARLIGERMGITRLAVIGKWNRLGMSVPRMAKVVKTRTYDAKPRVFQLTQNYKNITEPSLSIEEPTGKLWRGDLPKIGCCKWPYGQKGDWQWCTEAKLAGKPYCDYHLGLSHKQPRAA